MIVKQGLFQSRLEFVKITDCGLLFAQILVDTIVQYLDELLTILLVDFVNNIGGVLGIVIDAVQGV